MKLVAYLRSTPEEESRGNLGLDSQLDVLRKYVTCFNHEIVETYSDVHSGGNLDRPGLQAAIQAIDSGLAEGLLVYKISNLSRSVANTCDIYRDFIKKKKHLLTMMERVDSSTAMGQLILNVMVVISQYERELEEEMRESQGAKS
jgi:site-specific DNA recombinase